MSACHGDARRNGVPLSYLLLNLVVEVRKGSTHQWVTLQNLLKSRMFGEASELMPVEGFKEAINDSFVVVS